MKKLIHRAIRMSGFACFVVLCSSVRAWGQQTEGERIFKTVCFACHTINGGRLVGPDLANVDKRRNEDWIIHFVQSSQSMIKGGDEYAVKLFATYNRIPMPDHKYTADQVRSIIAYIAANSSTADTATVGNVAQPVTPAHAPATPQDIREGEALFVGARRFENGGAVCLSCHSIDHQGVPTGGTLGRNLTHAHSRLGDAGVTAILTSPPFPAMNRAFEGTPLTSQEAFQVASFIRSVDGTSARKLPRGVLFFVSGLCGAMLVLGLFLAMWVRGKTCSVNDKIYARQVKAIWKS